jgi:hypothetical protein
MHDKYYFLRRSNERVDEAPNLLAMRIEAVGIGSRIGKFFRMTHPDHIGCDQASKTLKFGNDVAPQVGGCRIAVQQNDRRSFAMIVEGHPLTVNIERSFGHATHADAKGYADALKMAFPDREQSEWLEFSSRLLYAPPRR